MKMLSDLQRVSKWLRLTVTDVLEQAKLSPLWLDFQKKKNPGKIRQLDQKSHFSITKKNTIWNQSVSDSSSASIWNKQVLKVLRGFQILHENV